MPTISDMKDLHGAQIWGRTWVPDVDLSGKTVVLTGANGGIGIECAKHLVRLKVSNLILACRNLEKGEKAKSTVENTTGSKAQTNIQVWQVDLANYRSIISFAARVRSELPRLDIFISNAGVKLWNYETAEGLERSLGINVVSTLLCAIGILPKLRETARTHNVHTTLTVVGSSYHIMGPDQQLEVPAGTNVFDALSDPETADMKQRYQLTKLVLHQCVAEFSKCVSTLEQSFPHRVVVNIVNPGACKTDLVMSQSAPGIERVFVSLVGWTPEKGSRSVVYAAVAGQESHGGYISESQLKQESSYIRSPRGRKIQQRLWGDLVAKLETISPDLVSFIR
ncbi:NAD(P)-binding protein [Thozetella sp. PMI_491]|nr:NAD(P)-binding protein [Thozetella sp. PMI_491]